MALKYVLLLLILSFSLSSSIALTIIGLLHVEHVNMIDSVDTKYGFPYWWLMHVSETIAGRTDIWRLETSNLVKDMMLFFLLSLGFLCVIVILLSKQRMILRTKIKNS